MIEILQSFPHVRVIYQDAEKIFCSVRVTVKRMEKINSGSMMFDHARYISFGQMVVFTDKEVEKDQGGALFFKVDSAEEAKDVINNIIDYIPREKEPPDDCVLMED